ncbi:MAG: NTP transferase domain-containing protein [Gammaproteobacteria bacterium]
MHALILAAGLGKRLALPHPKCLLRFGGETLLGRHIRLLHGLGIDAIHVVTGFGSQQVAQELGRLGLDHEVRLVFNPNYAAGSVVSLWCLVDVLRLGCEVLIMDADVLYDPQILARLVGSPHAGCFLLDRDYTPGDEPVKLCVRAGRLVEFRKRIAPDLTYDFSGESLGFFRFAPDMAGRLAEWTEAYITQGRSHEPHEEAIRDLLLEHADRMHYEDVTGLPWIEIDFPEDVVRAEREVLPRLNPTDD